MAGIKEVTIVEVVGVISIIAGLIVAITKIIKTAWGLHKRLMALEVKFEIYDNMVQHVNEHDVIIDRIATILNSLARESREYRNTSLADKIFQRLVKYRDRGGIITKAELENIDICKERYIKTLGNVKDWEHDRVYKFYQEILQMKVVDHYKD